MTSARLIEHCWVSKIQIY